jgi:hypothetical protein
LLLLAAALLPALAGGLAASGWLSALGVGDRGAWQAAEYARRHLPFTAEDVAARFGLAPNATLAPLEALERRRHAEADDRADLALRPEVCDRLDGPHRLAQPVPCSSGAPGKGGGAPAADEDDSDAAPEPCPAAMMMSSPATDANEATEPASGTAGSGANEVSTTGSPVATTAAAASS